ncbi:MAG: hypothetical protein HYS53_02620 [Candidatus Aenigmarchaeota archaeon]|nr:hypothetical protein [Candidatus Aenigmarchaeota archaeon]
MADQYDSISAAINNARSTLEKGRDPIRVIGRAAEYLKDAQDALPAAPTPGTLEHHRYSLARGMIRDLEKEIRGYARGVMQKSADIVKYQVGVVKSAVESEAGRVKHSGRIRKPDRRIPGRIDKLAASVGEAVNYINEIGNRLDDLGLRQADDAAYQKALARNMDTATDTVVAEIGRHQGYAKEYAKRETEYRKQKAGERVSRTNRRDLKRKVRVSALSRDLAALRARR